MLVFSQGNVPLLVSSGSLPTFLSLSPSSVGYFTCLCEYLVHRMQFLSLPVPGIFTFLAMRLDSSRHILWNTCYLLSVKDFQDWLHIATFVILGAFFWLFLSRYSLLHEMMAWMICAYIFLCWELSIIHIQHFLILNWIDKLMNSLS